MFIAMIYTRVGMHQHISYSLKKLMSFRIFRIVFRIEIEFSSIHCGLEYTLSKAHISLSLLMQSYITEGFSNAMSVACTRIYINIYMQSGGTYHIRIWCFFAFPFEVMGGNISDKLYGVNPQQIWRIKIFNFTTYQWAVANNKSYKTKPNNTEKKIPNLAQ